MDVLQFYAIVLFFVWIAAILFKDRLKLDITGYIIIRRTRRLNAFIGGFANKEFNFKFWRPYLDLKQKKVVLKPKQTLLKMNLILKVVMTIGIPISVYYMGFVVYSLISLPFMLQAPIGPILPGVDYPGNLLYIPLIYGLIALLTAYVIHEFGHGILARAEVVKVKSVGAALLAFIPCGFVEPDGEEMAKASKLAKLRIHAAGSISNLALGAIAFGIFYILSSFFIPFAFHSDGVLISSVIPKSPSDGILKEGMVIYNINGHDIKNFADHATFQNNTKIGDVLTIQTNTGIYKIKLASNPNNQTEPYTGLRLNNHLIVNKSFHDVYGDLIPGILYNLSISLYWIYFLNFLFGIFNLLPLKPLDGVLILKELLTLRMPKRKINSTTFKFKTALEGKLKLSEKNASRISSGIERILSFKIPEKKVDKLILTLSIIIGTFLSANLIYAIGQGIFLSI